ncbi:DUF1178 family protein [Paracoccus siganidrum]|uniref:DUF1178 family protein n=1 Tax=Paracoccus siganidrum TaxID=1276757 RepID=A0A419AA63_9RHOB|nr:DUF1178 family protein [Paracoccus siganidrum]RJL19521.1 DUF1178 family protein [Paracoccus siganidrum]RMC32236.1 DUF1178 domain-containing protein [Paracoccus siganidrum]
MIRYSLRCANGHDFDGWFRSSEGFETMRAAGQVSCARCGSASVEKALMAPAVPAEKTSLTEPRNPAEAALEKLREHVERNSDYVGLKFAEEARAMHEGHRPSRAIHGEARPEEARKLIEEGVPVAPLPFRPRQKVN